MTDLSAVLDSLREGVQVVDRSWRYVHLNSAAATHGRRRREELLGRTMMECYPGIETTPMFATLARCLETGEPGAMVNEFRYPDGDLRSFELRIQQCDVGIVILSIDVTERLRMEEQLHQRQKMEAIGRLAGGVAHDFNNLLSVISSYSSLLIEELAPTDPRREDAVAIRYASDKAAALTRQLLTIGAPHGGGSAAEARIVSLDDAVRDMDGMLRRAAGEGVTLAVHLPDVPLRVRIDPVRVDQILMNLVVNARDAMERPPDSVGAKPSGGKITIEIHPVQIDSAHAAGHLGVEPGDYVLLAVSDTGVGMDRATQARIFEPYFTTKPRGKGTGIGLSTVFGIVEESRGTIWVYSERGVGTTFKLYFPRVREEPETGSRAAVVVRGGTETLLLVEDHDEVRRSAATLLRRLGYRVLEACDTAEALAVTDPIALLVTDAVIAGQSCRALVTALSERIPGLRVLVVSGYTEHAARLHGLLDEPCAYLQKPLDPETLGATVRSVLDR